MRGAFNTRFLLLSGKFIGEGSLSETGCLLGHQRYFEMSVENTINAKNVGRFYFQTEVTSEYFTVRNFFAVLKNHNKLF